jgi:hypothetical protein
VTYERPAIERRVEVASPVIAGFAQLSGTATFKRRSTGDGTDRRDGSLEG